jgi:hypothetical protein
MVLELSWDMAVLGKRGQLLKKELLGQVLPANWLILIKTTWQGWRGGKKRLALKV